MCTLLARLKFSGLFFMTNVEIIGYYKGEQELCATCQRYQKNVEFVLRYMDEPLTILLCSSIHGKRPISGFPQSVQWFVDQQYLDTPFGLPFHTANRGCDACSHQSPHRYSLLPKRKGGQHYSQLSPARKRRRT